MISKLIVWGKNRQEASERLYQALDDYKVIGFPTNIKFMKRVLLNETFKTGLFDTSFIEQNINELVGDKPLSVEESNKRLASIALANIWFENENNRNRRATPVDPWHSYDNFRVNNVALREIVLEEGETLLGNEGEKKTHKLKIEYLSENKFNVLRQTDPLGIAKAEVLLKNAEVIENPEKPGELLISTDTEQFMLPYLRDENTGEVFCLDPEGAPLKIVSDI